MQGHPLSPFAPFGLPCILFLRVGHAFSPLEHFPRQMFPMHCPKKFRAGGGSLQAKWSKRGTKRGTKRVKPRKAQPAVLKLCQNLKSYGQKGLCLERKQIPGIDVRPCKSEQLMYGVKRSALPYKQEVRGSSPRPPTIPRPRNQRVAPFAHVSILAQS